MSTMRKNIIGGVSGAALALSTIFAATTTVIAQDNQPSMTHASIQQSQALSEAEALERSSGKVLLHYGEGITPLDVAVNVRALEKIGIANVEAYPGSENIGKFDVYFYGNKLPMSFEGNNGGSLGALVYGLAEKYDLLADNSPNSPEAG